MSLRHQAPTATFSLLSINNVQPSSLSLPSRQPPSRSLSLPLSPVLAPSLFPLLQPLHLRTNFLLAIYTDSLRYNTNDAIRFRLRISPTTCSSPRYDTPRNGLAIPTAVIYLPFPSLPFVTLPLSPSCSLSLPSDRRGIRSDAPRASAIPAFLPEISRRRGLASVAVEIRSSSDSAEYPFSSLFVICITRIREAAETSRSVSGITIESVDDRTEVREDGSIFRKPRVPAWRVIYNDLANRYKRFFGSRSRSKGRLPFNNVQVPWHSGSRGTGLNIAVTEGSFRHGVHQWKCIRPVVPFTIPLYPNRNLDR